MCIRDRRRGIKVIFDCNFRPSLWNENERKNVKSIYEDMLQLADIVFALSLIHIYIVFGKVK